MTAVSGRGSRASSSQISSVCHRRRSSDSVLPVSVTTAAAASSIKWPLTPSRPVIYPLKKSPLAVHGAFCLGFITRKMDHICVFALALRSRCWLLLAATWLLAGPNEFVLGGPRSLAPRPPPPPCTLQHGQDDSFLPPHWISPSTRAPQPVQGSGGANDIFVLSAALKVRCWWAGHWTRQ